MDRIYRISQGIYCFPAGYLIDRPDGYYVFGYGMGLGEGGRKKIAGGKINALEIESTFRLLKIKELCHDDRHAA
jgi:hypothetical protein